MNPELKRSLSLKKNANRLKYIDIDSPTIETFLEMLDQLCNSILTSPKCGCEKILCATCRRDGYQKELCEKIKKIVFEFSKFNSNQ